MLKNNQSKASSLELKKHIGTIHSNNSLTLLQRKIANALLYNAYDDLRSKSEHSIYINDLSRLIGYDSNDSKRIKESLVKLISTVIEWNLIDKEKEENNIWNASSVISDASICGSLCTYSYSNKMRELLYRPEIYGRLNIEVMSQFKSSYGLALYENCIRYQNIAQTPWFNIEIFRKLMGVEQNKYTIFRDLKRRVIDKAVSEVNMYAPIDIEVVFRKELRKVNEIQFLIKKKSANTSNATSKIDRTDDLLPRLKDEYGLSSKQIELLFLTYDTPYILEKMNVIETTSTYQNGKIINLAKYLQNALQDDYRMPKSSKKNAVDFYKKQAAKEADDKKEKKKIEAYRKFQDQEILRIFKELEPTRQKAIETKFAEFIQKNIYGVMYEKNGLENILVLDKLCEFVRAYEREIMAKIAPYADFTI